MSSFLIYILPLYFRVVCRCCYINGLCVGKGVNVVDDSLVSLCDEKNRDGSSVVVNEESVNNCEIGLPPAMGPLVSVIIPSYNHAKFIRQAIYSVVNQTYKNIQLIIIDDGSQDGSPSLIDEVIAGIDRLPTRLILQENRGAHDAINRGISLAEGEYIAILNSDDFYYPNRIEKLVNKAGCERCEFIFSKVDHVSSDGSPLEGGKGRCAYMLAYAAWRSLPTIGYTLMNYNLAVSTSNFFIKKSLAEKVGQFKKYKAVHDWDYLLRVLLETEPCFLDESLMAYRIHEHNTLSGLSHIGIRETNQIFNCYVTSLVSGKARNRLAPEPRNRKCSRKMSLLPPFVPIIPQGQQPLIIINKHDRADFRSPIPIHR